MLRISPVESTGPRVVLRVEGRVIGPWVDELRRSCETALGHTGARLTLDLRGVTFLDPDGIALVRGLLARDPGDVSVTNGSPFVSAQLRGSRPDPATDGRSG
jgi:hypothetical protein